MDRCEYCSPDDFSSSIGSWSMRIQALFQVDEGSIGREEGGVDWIFVLSLPTDPEFEVCRRVFT